MQAHTGDAFFVVERRSLVCLYSRVALGVVYGVSSMSFFCDSLQAGCVPKSVTPLHRVSQVAFSLYREPVKEGV